MPTAEAVAAVARSWVGLREDPPGSNRTTLVAGLDARFGPIQLSSGAWVFRNGYEWCASAVAAWHHEAAGWSTGWDLPIQSFYTPADCNRWRSIGRWYGTGQVGDHIYFDWDGAGTVDHVGLVVADLGWAWQTVEGNLSNAVQLVTRPKSARQIAGFGRPDYAATPSPPPIPEDDDMALHIVRSNGTQPECLLVNGVIVGFSDPGERDRALAATGAGTWIVDSDAQWEAILRAHQ